MTTTDTPPDPRPRAGKRRPYRYVQGADRVKLRALMAKQYTAGASIRMLADEHDLSYSGARNILIEAARAGLVTLRAARRYKTTGKQAGRG